ncbi:phage exclusion protein Lit family protein [Acidisphaera rubrifaciens]|uniref:Phage exclusion protein Lit n=1 Tax=Acidisphaera rubrifaciens HS-AP3 TaxID=1231350 RepID=A0A0D6P3Q1_9PROT|nr:phage exclusion protein Lit family protein [Acidisphaera rubrifaciens]GAN75818.1 phage exclusion protein Lit [Acidisphaera rubrifaciens HS-AP3]
MDVSYAVDTLFAGVVPERLDELKNLWGQHAERVRLLDVPRFLLQQLYGTVQVSEVALRQIWLTGYAAWSAVQAYNVPLALSAVHDAPLDIAAWHAVPSQAERDFAFDSLFDKLIELGRIGSLEGFNWPENVPYPQEGLKITDPEMKGTFDLVCMAGAYVFAHEVRHGVFEQEGSRPNDLVEEEWECDRWALSLMLDEAEDYANRNGWAPSDVRAKRLLGIIIAKLTILALTPRSSWDESEDHPPVRERMQLVLDAAVDPVPDWFWITVTSMLLAFARRLGISITPRPLPPSFRSLSYNICELLTSH